MTYGDFKGLPRKGVSDTELRDKAFTIAVNPKYEEYQTGFSSIFFKFLDKSSSSTRPW